MNKGLIRMWIPAVALLLPLVVFGEGQIWKVVDENGNVTYTDQKPADGSAPMDLPELSVIESDIEVPDPNAAAAAADEPQEMTIRDLRKQFRDFRITQPSQEETFWGTANSVVVTWESSAPIPPDMKVTVFVDGQPQDAGTSGAMTLTLDRGEHQVYAELRDGRNRQVVTTEVITFFVKQHSANFGRPQARPLGRN